ncbi:hypothetical protein [Pedobacter nototheniae]|uniref:hypothetical protein n=1 Tax=Pedobacter nototheniae TaxID=2488994 RepID=UPI00292D48F4|nr:hypothetical protein [Pedobacter nototheniae]
MESISRFILLISLISCLNKQEGKNAVPNLVKPDTVQQNQIKKQDGLFKLDVNLNKNFVKIIAPKNSKFKFPDSSAKTKPYKLGDFNADKKEDILVYLGACGTGGCMYGLFLNQYDNYYKLAFMNYLKNAEFEIEKNGLWTIKSSEEIEPYNPSKLQIAIFKFDKTKYQYKLDTTYVHIDTK